MILALCHAVNFEFTGWQYIQHDSYVNCGLSELKLR